MKRMYQFIFDYFVSEVKLVVHTHGIMTNSIDSSTNVLSNHHTVRLLAVDIGTV